MKRRREELGYSLQDLADITETFGHPLKRSTLSSYETGRSRKISLPDALVIAAALGSSIAALLYPTMPDGEVDWLPSKKWNAWDAGRSLLGINPPGYYGERLQQELIRMVHAEEDPAERKQFAREISGTTVVRLSHLLIELRGEAFRLLEDRDNSDEWLAAYTEVQKTIALISKGIRDLGGVVDDEYAKDRDNG